MRLRVLGAAVIAVLAATVLTACHTNVGTAARIDGHSVSESDVANYLTAKAKAAPALLNPAAALPTRTYVLDVLIAQRFTAALVRGVQGAPSASAISHELESERGGKSYAAFASALGQRLGAQIPAGYSEGLYQQAALAMLNTEVLSTATQSGVDLQTLLAKLKFPLWINPRYGTWSKSTLSMNGAGGRPSFVKLVPTAG